MDLLIYANQIFIALIVKKISTTRISVALKVPPHSSFDTFRYVQLLKLKKIMSPLEFQAHVVAPSVFKTFFCLSLTIQVHKPGTKADWKRGKGRERVLMRMMCDEDDA